MKIYLVNDLRKFGKTIAIFSDVEVAKEFREATREKLVYEIEERTLYHEQPPEKGYNK